MNKKLALILVISVAALAQAKTIYVKEGSTGDGTSWSSAYGEFQPALDEAVAGDEIWVAEGMYTPTDYKHFSMINGVAIYGGFPFLGNPDIDARNPDIYETILSGDIAGNDVLVGDPAGLHWDPNRSENFGPIFYHPLGTNLDPNAILDGFVIIDGRSNYGGGMYNANCSPSVINCTFRNNSAYHWSGMSGGGGMFNVADSKPIVLNCRFENNYGTSGGGILNFIESSPQVKDCVFIGNCAGSGGGIYNNDYGSTVIDCTFVNNSANGGGGIGGNATVIGCTFTGNSARYLNYLDEYNGYGGGISGGEFTTVTNCVFTGNLSVHGGGIARAKTVVDSVFNSNSAKKGGGLYDVAVITNCIFTSNSGTHGGGILTEIGPGPVALTNCLFSNNSAYSGGGVYSEAYLDVRHCTFSSNHANNGGGIFIRNYSALIKNCLLWGNTRDQLDSKFGEPPWYVGTNRIYIAYSNIAQCRESGVDWDGNLGHDWGGNIDADPLFVDPGYWDPNNTPDNTSDDFFVSGDYHLKSQGGRYDPVTKSWIYDDVTSPCIDAGDPMSPIGTEPFSNGGIVNMGSYGGTSKASKSYFGKTPCETIVAGDINGDCEINLIDFSILVLHWLENHNQ